MKHACESSPWIYEGKEAGAVRSVSEQGLRPPRISCPCPSHCSRMKPMARRISAPKLSTPALTRRSMLQLLLSIICPCIKRGAMARSLGAKTKPPPCPGRRKHERQRTPCVLAVVRHVPPCRSKYCGHHQLGNVSSTGYGTFLQHLCHGGRLLGHKRTRQRSSAHVSMRQHARGAWHGALSSVCSSPSLSSSFSAQYTAPASHCSKYQH